MKEWGSWWGVLMRRCGGGGWWVVVVLWWSWVKKEVEGGEEKEVPAEGGGGGGGEYIPSTSFGLTAAMAAGELCWGSRHVVSCRELSGGVPPEPHP